jgi:hypothetical protein
MGKRSKARQEERLVGFTIVLTQLRSTSLKACVITVTIDLVERVKLLTANILNACRTLEASARTVISMTITKQNVLG